MFYFLLLLGFIASAAGVFMGGFGVPIRETAFGAALLMAGSVAITGGFILVGLAAAVRELQRVVQGLKARAPGPPRPGERRNGERREREHIEGADRGPEPRLPVPDVVDADALNVIPTKFNAPDTPEQPREPEPEWLRRAMAQVEAATQPPAAASAPDDGRADEVRRPSDILLSDHAETERRQASAASSRNVFDTVWPLEHRSSDEAPGHPTEVSPATGTRPAAVKLPPVAPAPPPVAPVPPRIAPLRAVPPRPVHAEPRPLPILKSGMIDEMAYTLFADGSIEAQMPDGTMRFGSIEELRQHLEKSGGS